MHILNTLGSSQLSIQFHSGDGAILRDIEGKEYWDFYGGHAVTLIGNSHPKWADAISKQAQLLGFCTTISPLAIRSRVAERLCAFTNMDVAWFVNAGAEANEGALKIARKYTGKTKIIAMEHGFHGRTMGALGVTWKYREQHHPIHGDCTFVPFGDIDALKQNLDTETAAVIVEPIQGIAGIIEPPEQYLKEVSALCAKLGVLLICDEVQSGMGRTGSPLLSTTMGADPDIVTLGKGLGGGFPVSAVLIKQHIADTIKPGEHGSTFGGSPLACAAIEATMDIIEEEHLMDTSLQLEQSIRTQLDIPGVVAIRGKGAWLGVELNQPAKPIIKKLLEDGVFVGGSSHPNTLRVSPPANMPQSGVEQLKASLKKAFGIKTVQTVVA